ncbi:EAL domain-containing protein [Geobacillus thermodenitrificans]|uniref:EAL domain-containing protein n=1 Tax=Geobacillus thermodenitrificans TaxID=33940 RepID=UPI0022AAE908|nr:EAL domain-containing protein [Geobacillus thermodenitrificans]
MKNLPHSADDQAIIAADIKMARQLGIDTLAEGIENKEQIQQLKEMEATAGKNIFGVRLYRKRNRFWTARSEQFQYT